MYFSELSSDETRALFDVFVAAWNAGEVPMKCYEGINSGAGVPRTRPRDQAASARSVRDSEIRSRKRALVDRREAEQSHREDTRRRDKESRRKKHREHKEYLEEMFPKATGRDALREKKAANRSLARERERSPDGMGTIPESSLMGGGDDFEEARRREQARHARRNEARERKQLDLEEKLSKFQQEEEKKMDQFRALLAQGPIKIKKRSDA